MSLEIWHYSLPCSCQNPAPWPSCRPSWCPGRWALCQVSHWQKSLPPWRVPCHCHQQYLILTHHTLNIKYYQYNNINYEIFGSGIGSHSGQEARDAQTASYSPRSASPRNAWCSVECTAAAQSLAWRFTPWLVQTGRKLTLIGTTGCAGTAASPRSSRSTLRCQTQLSCAIGNRMAPPYTPRTESWDTSMDSSGQGSSRGRRSKARTGPLAHLTSIRVTSFSGNYCIDQSELHFTWILQHHYYEFWFDLFTIIFELSQWGWHYLIRNKCYFLLNNKYHSLAIAIGQASRAANVQS